MRVLVVLLCACGRVGFAPIGSNVVGGDGGKSGDGGNGSASDGSAGDGSASDAIPQPLCGSTSLLFDDFEDGVKAPEWTVRNGMGMNVAETGGLLQITFQTNAASGQDAGYETTSAMDFTNTCVTAELVSVPNPATSAFVWLHVGGVNSHVAMYVDGGMLTSTLREGTVNNDGAPLSYDPVAHRWLRMVETAGTWFFQVSPDGATFTTVAALQLQFSAQTSTTMVLEALSGAGGNGLGMAQFGSVRVTGP